MRSTIKILLGISIITGIIYALIGFVCSITVLIAPQTLSVMFPPVKVDNNQARLIALISLIMVGVSILSVFVSRYAIAKMDSVENKKQLIPSILMLFFTLSVISSILMLFTPTVKLISKHPYFE